MHVSYLLDGYSNADLERAQRRRRRNHYEPGQIHPADDRDGSPASPEYARCYAERLRYPAFRSTRVSASKIMR